MKPMFEKMPSISRRARPLLTLVFGVGLSVLFAYWLWRFWVPILDLLNRIGWLELLGLAVLVLTSTVVTVFVLVTLLRSKGYKLGFLDSYYALNISQLASMIPGGVWGFAGFAGVLWSKGVSKPDSAIVIFLNTLIMLTACAIVGISGLATILGSGFAFLVIAPFMILVLARNRLESLRQEYYPSASSLPSITAMLFSLLLGVVVWIIVSACFAAFLYQSTDLSQIPFLVAIGAYATGYLGGYLAIFAPSGIGVSEGLTSLILSPYVPTETTLAVAVAFRIFHTLIIWLNLLMALILHAGKNSQATS